MKNEDYAIFDVCNDYSLDKADISKFNKSDYRVKLGSIEGKPVKLYYHKEYGELHYCYAPKAFQDMYL